MFRLPSVAGCTAHPFASGRPRATLLLGIAALSTASALVAGCSHPDAAATAPAVPTVRTSVPGGTLVVPDNLPPGQQAQIRAQEQADIQRNMQHATPPPAGK